MVENRDGRSMGATRYERKDVMFWIGLGGLFLRL